MTIAELAMERICSALESMIDTRHVPLDRWPVVRAMITERIQQAIDGDTDTLTKGVRVSAANAIEIGEDLNRRKSANHS